MKTIKPFPTPIHANNSIAIRAAFALIALAAMGAGAQQFSIPWHKIAGGGTVSVGGHFQLNGTIGQPDAGTAATTASAVAPASAGAGNAGLANAIVPTVTQYQLTAGFRAIILQQTGAPVLTMSAVGAGGNFMWTTITTGYTLQQSISLDPSATWTDVNVSVTTNGTSYQVAMPVPSGASVMFFRLRK